MRRTSAVVRAWDGPNSRIAFEMDLDQMPWGPFEALGKKVTLLIPDEVVEAEPDREEASASHLERALRHVEHAAEKCAEFERLGNGSDQLWRRSLETWEWLRDFLTSAWMETERGDEGSEPAPTAVLPGMPGAAATLEVAAAVLRDTPLSTWRDAVGTFNPDAPTREEAIQTLLGVAKLLARSPGRAAPPDEEGAPAAPEVGAAPAVEAVRTATTGEKGAADAPRAAEPASRPHEGEGGNGELSFDYAAGYDEGYRMGRRVGRALGAREGS